MNLPPCLTTRRRRRRPAEPKVKLRKLSVSPAAQLQLPQDANNPTGDPRFANIQSDPRYRLPSKRHTHVKLDKRFAHMFHDQDFSRNAAVDRYGRKLARDDTKKQLEKFYRLGEDSEEDDGVSADDDDEVQKELKKVESRSYDPARDGGFTDSSSEEESSSDEEEEEEEEADEEAEELDFPDKQEANVPLGEVSERIAVVNLDWDNVRAEDLMAVFSSFLPTGGRVRNVAVYPSEFGKERMEREEVEGPPREIFASNKKGKKRDEEDEELDSDEEEEQIKQSMLKEDEGEEFNSTQLRRYQLERLRYYYAILTFSSKEAAKHVYDLVDGAEYLSSANFFDLRFVPDETDFSEDKPRDECDHIPDGYRPNDFVTDALQHSRVKLTWDADDSGRKEAQARAFRGSRKDIDENDLKAYLGTDSSEDEDEDEEVEVVDTTKGDTNSKMSKKEAEKQRVRALLGLSTEPSRPSKPEGPVGEMEVTFTSGLAGGTNQDSVFENEPEREETTLDKYLRKERERKKRRKDRGKNKQGEPTDEQGQADEARDEEAEAGESQEGDLGFDDPFFDNPDSQENASARRKEEKRKKREEKEAEEAEVASKRAELELLMLDDKQSEIKHFDMNEIEKAEKNARKKKGKGKGKDKAAEGVVDDFQMDVSDPRFGRLYESHEFAIDPTNPRFKATPGMKALLEEGRKRRRNRDERDEVPEEVSDRKKKQKKGSSKEKPEELKKLVDKVKRKTQQ